MYRIIGQAEKMLGLTWDSGRLTFIRGRHSIFLEYSQFFELIPVSEQKRPKTNLYANIRGGIARQSMAAVDNTGMDTVSKKKRSWIMAQVRSKGNKSTEFGLLSAFRRLGT